ncbi:MAG: hypothetical protein ACLTER_12675 [Ruminococcus sp.]
MTKEKKERITVIVQNLKQMDIVSLKLMENNSELHESQRCNGSRNPESRITEAR